MPSRSPHTPASCAHAPWRARSGPAIRQMLMPLLCYITSIPIPIPIPKLRIVPRLMLALHSANACTRRTGLFLSTGLRNMHSGTLPSGWAGLGCTRTWLVNPHHIHHTIPYHTVRYRAIPTHNQARPRPDQQPALCARCAFFMSAPPSGTQTASQPMHNVRPMIGRQPSSVPPTRHASLHKLNHLAAPLHSCAQPFVCVARRITPKAHAPTEPKEPMQGTASRSTCPYFSPGDSAALRIGRPADGSGLLWPALLCAHQPREESRRWDGHRREGA